MNINSDIFVSTCGFNERYIRETIENAYDMAADPDRVTFGIFDQKSSGVPIENYKGLKRVKVVHASADEPVGVGQARLNASLLHASEKYLCQIDSHNLFAKDWDAKCVDAYETLLAVADRPIIAQSAMWHHQHTLTPEYRTNWSEYASCVKPAPLKLSPRGNTIVDVDRAHETKILGRFLEHHLFYANGFFTTSKFIYEVSHNPFVKYFCEQELSSLRAATRGYRMFSTDLPIFSTMTKTVDGGAFNDEDFPDDMMAVRSRAFVNSEATLRHITGQQFGWYGAPDQQSYDKYIRESGNDFVNAHYAVSFRK